MTEVHIHHHYHHGEKPKAAVVFALLDESGSMSGHAEETQQAFNAYVNGLKPKDASDVPLFISAFRFDYSPPHPIMRTIYDDINVLETTPFTTYKPRGYTPLYDAIGQMLVKADAAVAKHGADRVVVMIQTDGVENQSREYRGHMIRAMIEERKAKGWQFIFLGADLSNTYAMAGNLGIGAATTMSYAKGQTVETFTASAQNARAFASGMVGSTEYTPQQRRQGGDKQDGA